MSELNIHKNLKRIEYSSLFILFFILFLLMNNALLFASQWTSLQLDNDIFYETDGQYSHGLHVSFSQEINKTHVWNRWMKFVLETDHRKKTYVEHYVLSHQFYTPNLIKLSTPALDDRPYAGFLGFTCGLQTLNSRMYWQLGLVGPGTMADEYQIWLHERGDWPVPQGWGHQLHNELIMQTGYERQLTVVHTQWSSMDQFNGQIGLMMDFGNKITSAGSSGRISWGWGGMHGLVFPKSGNTPQKTNRSSFGGIVDLSVRGWWILHDIFLDGNIFHSSQSVNKHSFRGEIQAGLSLSLHSWVIGYKHVHCSKYFKGQEKEHRYGVVYLACCLL